MRFARKRMMHEFGAVEGTKTLEPTSMFKGFMCSPVLVEHIVVLDSYETALLRKHGKLVDMNSTVSLRTSFSPFEASIEIFGPSKDE